MTDPTDRDEAEQQRREGEDTDQASGAGYGNNPVDDPEDMAQPANDA